MLRGEFLTTKMNEKLISLTRELEWK